MEKYPYICNHKPDVSGRHIGESVTLLSSRGNLVNFNLDGDLRGNAHHLLFSCGHTPRGIHRCGVVVYYVQGFTRASTG